MAQAAVIGRQMFVQVVAKIIRLGVFTIVILCGLYAASSVAAVDKPDCKGELVTIPDPNGDCQKPKPSR